MAELVYLEDVVTLAYDAEKCVGCAMCTLVCPHRIFELNGKKAVLTARDACMECGACATNCPTGAITVDSGVGCAAAIIGSAFRKDGAVCC